MPKFESLDDNISNQEAGLSLGRVRDVNGNDWNTRKDEVLKKYLAKTSISPEDKLKLRGMIDMRNWLETQAELGKLLRSADTDDTIRINKAIDMIDEIMNEGRNVE